MVTLNATSLYTNIPTPMGIQAAKEAFEKFRPNTDLKPSNDSLIKLLECIPTKKCYLHIKGYAMGSRVALTFANTYISKFDDDHGYTYRLQPFMYVRYFDDTFLIWQHGLEELYRFVRILERTNTFSGHNSQKCAVA